MKPISNTQVAKILGKSYDQVNYMQKKNFRDLELIKKGIIYEKIESNEVANVLIKKQNKQKG